MLLYKSINFSPIINHARIVMNIICLVINKNQNCKRLMSEGIIWLLLKKITVKHNILFCPSITITL